MGTGKLLGKPNKLWGSDLRWTSIPSRRSRNTSIRFMIQKPAATCMSQSWLQGFTHAYLSRDSGPIVARKNILCPKRTNSSVRVFIAHFYATKINKLTSCSFSCICPVNIIINDEFRHNIVKVAVDPRGDKKPFFPIPKPVFQTDHL